MTAQTEGQTTPYIANIRGRFHVVWAESHDAPFTIDRAISRQRKYNAAVSSCVGVYGITPSPYGIGF